MQTKQDGRLGTEKIGKLMLELALPSVLAQIVNVLYNIVDRIYIGRIPDVGSLALGAGLAAMSILLNAEWTLLLIGLIFVIETASVMLQVFWFKRTGKRIFKMSPIHHHFELKGWQEPKVIVRFWIISILLALLSLATLKIR